MTCLICKISGCAPCLFAQKNAGGTGICVLCAGAACPDERRFEIEEMRRIRSAGASSPYLAPAPPRSVAAVTPNATDMTIESIQLDVLALADTDIEVRLAAFQRLRRVPREYVETAWNRTRRKTPTAGRDLDCLQRLEIEPPGAPIRARRAVVTVISAGYESILRVMLESLARFGECAGVPVAVFLIDGAGEDLKLDPPRGLDLRFIAARSVERISNAVKGAIYSCARWIDAETIVALEADMLVVASLKPLFELLENAHPSAMAGCRAQALPDRYDLREVLLRNSAAVSDLEFLTGRADFNSLFHFNGGLLAGRRQAWHEFDSQISEMMPFASLFVEGGMNCLFGDEFVMNTAIGLMENNIELAPTWNTQFYNSTRENWLQTARTEAGMRYTRLGDPVRLLHFLSVARQFMGDVVREVEQFGLDSATGDGIENEAKNHGE